MLGFIAMFSVLWITRTFHISQDHTLADFFSVHPPDQELCSRGFGTVQFCLYSQQQVQTTGMDGFCHIDPLFACWPFVNPVVFRKAEPLAVIVQKQRDFAALPVASTQIPMQTLEAKPSSFASKQCPRH